MLELHHIDRDPDNNADENVTLLCPTCHSVDHHWGRDGQYANNLGRLTDG